MGRKPLLSTEVEQELIQRIFRFAVIGLPLTSKMIGSYVFEYADKNGLAHPFTTNKAGEKWFRPFMQRWPELRRWKAQHMNPVRAQKLNQFIVRDHFLKLKETLKILNFLINPTEFTI